MNLDVTWTGTTTPCQSEPGSNGNESVTSQSPDLQNWSLTTGGSSMSEPGCLISKKTKQKIRLKTKFKELAVTAIPLITIRKIYKSIQTSTTKFLL